MSHTPGPWVAQRNSVHFSDNQESKAIASCWDYDHDTNKANARLIAAAPDMLALLERMEAIEGHPCVCEVLWSNHGRHSEGEGRMTRFP